MCSFASLAAREVALEELEEPRLERSRKSVTRKDFEGVSARVPWPKDLGQRLGTELCMAFRDACSPVMGMLADDSMIGTEKEAGTFEHG